MLRLDLEGDCSTIDVSWFLLWQGGEDVLESLTMYSTTILRSVSVLKS